MHTTKNTEAMKTVKCTKCGKFISDEDLADESKVSFLHIPDRIKFGWAIAEQTLTYHKRCYNKIRKR